MARSGAPQKGTDMAGINRSAGPVDLPRGVQLHKQLLVQRIPHPGLLPGPQPPPTSDPGPVAILARQVLPGDSGVQHVQDPIERQPIIDRLAAGVATTTLTHRDQRLDLGPQLITDLESKGHLPDLQSSGAHPKNSKPPPPPLP